MGDGAGAAPPADSLLAGLPEAAVAGILALGRPRTYGAGQAVFKRDDPGGTMLLVLEGRLKVTAASADGREVTLHLAGPGELLGEIALFDGGPRTADVVALDGVRALVVERGPFLAFLERSPAVAIRLLELVCRRLRRTDATVEGAALLPLEARLARAIHALAARHGRAAAGGAVLLDLRALGMSQRDVAALVGASREAVNRRLRAWAEAGLVGLGPGRIVLPDPSALAALGQGDSG